MFTHKQTFARTKVQSFNCRIPLCVMQHGAKVDATADYHDTFGWHISYYTIRIACRATREKKCDHDDDDDVCIVSL